MMTKAKIEALVSGPAAQLLIKYGQAWVTSRESLMLVGAGLARLSGATDCQGRVLVDLTAETREAL